VSLASRIRDCALGGCSTTRSGRRCSAAPADAFADRGSDAFTIFRMAVQPCGRSGPSLPLLQADAGGVRECHRIFAPGRRGCRLGILAGAALIATLFLLEKGHSLTIFAFQARARSRRAGRGGVLFALFGRA
jgi:hypothetical protein